MARFRNFAKSKLAAGIAAGATSISLHTGDGGKFPDETPFDITLWNKTDFPDPADDPEAEELNVTAVSGDTFTISAAAHDHNTSGKEYGVIASWNAALAELAIPRFVDVTFNAADFVAGNAIAGGVWTVSSVEAFKFARVGDVGFLQVIMDGTGVVSGTAPSMLCIRLPAAIRPASSSADCQTGLLMTVDGYTSFRPDALARTGHNPSTFSDEVHIQLMLNVGGTFPVDGNLSFWLNMTLDLR